MTKLDESIHTVRPGEYDAPASRRMPTIRLKQIGRPGSPYIFSITEIANFDEELTAFLIPYVGQKVLEDDLMPVFDKVRTLPSLAVIVIGPDYRLSSEFEQIPPDAPEAQNMEV